MLGSMYTPDNMEHQFTLLTATARHDQLRTRDALAPPADPGADGDEAPEERSAVPLNKNEALELIARKAGYSRQLGVRTARAAGASWSEIGAALGTSKQSAWEAHARWLEDQVQ